MLLLYFDLKYMSFSLGVGSHVVNHVQFLEGACRLKLTLQGWELKCATEAKRYIAHEL